MVTNLEVIVGTYEQFLLGYKVEQEDDKYSLHQSFAVHAHIASVRTVDTKGKFLASGGADDRIYVYDMKKRQEVQLLTTHDACVNHLRFTPDATHMFSASSDGSLAATRTGSWVAEGFWKAPHGGKAITHISIHPSGKLALTLGADLTLKTWNLMKGRQIFTTNLKSKSSLGRTIEYVEFSPTGENFILTGAKAVEVWDINTAGVIKTLECESKPTSICWLNESNFLVGLNDGKLLWSSLHDDEPLKFEMYGSRVKGIYYFNGHLASISSDGDVTVWTVNIEEQEITELCSTNIGCRPICLAVLNLADFANEYVLKREDTDEENEKTTEKNGSNRGPLNKQVGKVVIENDDDSEEDQEIEEEKVAQKKTPNKGKGTKKHQKNGANKSNQQQTKSTPSPSVNKKRKSINDSQASSAKKAKKLKSKSRSNNSTFVEEDME